jgi:MoaA/NifB/PqqE/SkfB family radical SAM enzyme/GT2 family glycosyltransferase
MQPARTPRILWVELTSKCPFDCVFCSRKSRRGAGEHMPFALFESLVGQLSDPRKFLLNYSGESTVYPDLIRAIRLARSTGAAVELVSALANAPDSLLEELAGSGLTRLTVSVHAAGAAAFTEIYRHSSLAALRSRLSGFVELSARVEQPPVIDLAFVAMPHNLGELNGVAAMAAALDLRALSIFPLIRRDPIPLALPGDLKPADLQHAVADVAARFPELSFTVCNPMFTGASAALGENPAACPGDLPAGAVIHSCEQNPWETAHVLSNGDVVACEVHDKTPLGNLARQSLLEVWNGELYRRFRAAYRTGELPECRSCVWKTAYIPGRLRSDIVASRGRNAQLWHGWHEPDGGPHIWSSQQAVAILQPRPGSRILHLNGTLPPGPPGRSNELTVCCNGVERGAIANSSPEPLHFGIDLPAPPDSPWKLEFRTAHVHHSAGDSRDLGFALCLAASQPPLDPERTRRQSVAVRPLLDAIAWIDRLGRALSRAYKRSQIGNRVNSLSPGLTVIIPERDNPAELESCLDALREAAGHWNEPFEAIVVVNGCKSAPYQAFQARYPAILWQFHPEPLGFARAIRAGLLRAHHPWVYLLNSDVALAPDALTAAGRLRDPAVFSIASEIILRDPTRFREETNWTTLFLEDGLAATHDRIPPPDCGPMEHFYSGGGASLFQRDALLRIMDVSAYDPFYWEDVEWGWRARKLGYSAVFCPDSVARHTQGATISRSYAPAEIEAILQRNRLLFHLRNLTSAGSLDPVVAAISRSERRVAGYFQTRKALTAIARGRIWNHLAPVSDHDVLATIDTSLPTVCYSI